MTRSKHNISMGFCTVGEKYWNVVDALCEGIIRNRNATSVTSHVKIPPEEVLQKTKWSDLNLAVPLLFNFYHGVELMLKGFVLPNQKTGTKQPNHRLSSLLSSFSEKYPHEKNLSDLLGKYLQATKMPGILRDFFNANSTDPDRFYDCLKYPFSKDLSQQFDHYQLTYKGKRGVQFYRDLQTDIARMMILIVSLERSLCR